MEEETSEPNQDEIGQVFRRTLTLVIKTLLPRHAAEYVCKAENKVGTVEKTYRIDVTCKYVYVGECH